MKTIGGYFELELSKENEYHSTIAVNSGRSAFELILKAREYKKVFIPLYTCEVISKALDKMGIEYEFYKLNNNLEPEKNWLSSIAGDEALLYTNYFGLKDDFIGQIGSLCKNVIIDNCQSFYSRPQIGFDTFYSPRKFFGVPDGGYLFLRDNTEVADIPLQDIVYNRSLHLLKRIDLSPQEGYKDFVANESEFNVSGVRRMSKVSTRILSSINYTKIKDTRRKNFEFLQKSFHRINILNLDYLSLQESTPMVYPLLIEFSGLREWLTENQIYTAKYWQEVFEKADCGSFESHLSSNLISLPIDQRYNIEDMEYIVKIIKKKMCN